MPGTPTTKYSIPTLNASGTDAINVSHTALNSAFTTIDGAMAGYAEGTFAGKPAAGKAGRIYRCTDTGQWLADTGAVWVDLNAAPALVTSLPGSPFDGQEIYFSADPTNGVVWHLRYRSASGSSYKWEFVGGSPLSGDASGSTSITGTATWVDLTGNPTFTLALAGDYLISWTSQASTSGGLSGIFGSAPKIGATTPPSTDSSLTNVATSSFGITGRTDVLRTITAAATVVKLQHFAAMNAAVDHRNLSIRPVRVG